MYFLVPAFSQYAIICAAKILKYIFPSCCLVVGYTKLEHTDKCAVDMPKKVTTPSYDSRKPLYKCFFSSSLSAFPVFYTPEPLLCYQFMRAPENPFKTSQVLQTTFECSPRLREHFFRRSNVATLHSLCLKSKRPTQVKSSRSTRGYHPLQFQRCCSIV